MRPKKKLGKQKQIKFDIAVEAAKAAYNRRNGGYEEERKSGNEKNRAPSVQKSVPENSKDGQKLLTQEVLAGKHRAQSKRDRSHKRSKSNPRAEKPEEDEALMKVDARSTREADEVMTHSHTPLRGGLDSGKECLSNCQNQAIENAPHPLNNHSTARGKNMETDEMEQDDHPEPGLQTHRRLTKLSESKQ